MTISIRGKFSMAFSEYNTYLINSTMLAMLSQKENVPSAGLTHGLSHPLTLGKKSLFTTLIFYFKAYAENALGLIPR